MGLENDSFFAASKTGRPKKRKAADTQVGQCPKHGTRLLPSTIVLVQKRATTGRAAKATAATTRKRRQDDEDLDETINSDDDDNVAYEEEAQEDEFADETADEKRVRLAKKYLADLGHGVDAGEEDEDEDDAAVRRKQALDHSAIAHRFETDAQRLARFPRSSRGFVSRAEQAQKGCASGDWEMETARSRSNCPEVRAELASLPLGVRKPPRKHCGPTRRSTVLYWRVPSPSPRPASARPRGECAARSIVASDYRSYRRHSGTGAWRL
jgi:hypothetical protein